MEYNNLVNSKTSFLDAVRLVRFAAFFWIGYLAVLAIINWSFGDPRRGASETTYYIILGSIALLCLGLSFWPWIQDQFGRAFIPLIIAIITVLPISSAWIIFRFFPRSPMFDSESSVLRMLPFLLVGFLLVAWKYRWQYILLIVLGITALNIAIIWSFPAPGVPQDGNFFRGMFTIPLIQALVFLAVGFSISYLMNRLKKQQQSLEEANANLNHYASTLEQLATTRERSRLARELHDTLAHTLSGLTVQLETIKAYWDIDLLSARSLLEKSLDTAHSGLEETRRSLKALRASPLEDMGLSGAVRTMAQSLAVQSNLLLDFSITGQMPVLSPDVEQCIYRITQEAITNVIAHARARHLTVKLDYIDGKMNLLVQDDGIGFDMGKNSTPIHFGLKGIKERAQLIGGVLDIFSQPGQGTSVRLTI